MQNPNARILALDVGAKRIGVASANVIARLASPLTTLTVTDTILDDIKELIAQESAMEVVIGLPRGLDGQETEQTKYVRRFAERLHREIPLPLHLQDEALTSRLSEATLSATGKGYSKGAIDALAACMILEDYLRENPGNNNV